MVGGGSTGEKKKKALVSFGGVFLPMRERWEK